MIGIFDSGSGGLTVLRAIREARPSCDVLYFGDIKNAPYGGKSHEELSKLTINALKLLRKRGATNKRVSNARLRATGWEPKYPRFQDGIEQSVLPAFDLLGA
jgi:glutamate racemase